MATMPMMNMEPEDEMSEGAEPMGAEMQEGESDGTYYIEIAVHPDGSFTVGVESAEYEAAEEQGAQSAGAQKEEGKSFDNVKDALQAVLDIVKGKGAATSQAPLAAGQERSQMLAGFNSGRA